MGKRKNVVTFIYCFCVVIKLASSQSGIWSDHSTLHSDFASNEDKTHLDNMARELYHTMQLQERQLLAIKEECVGSIAYQVGLVIGLMREKYKRMMDIYSEFLRRYTGQTLIVGPGIWEFKPIHVMVACNDVRMIEMEIYKYIDLLLKLHPMELDETPKPDQMVMPPSSPGRTGNQSNKTVSISTLNLPKLNLRNAAQPEQNSLTEQDIKRQYRENYMKQHGQDSQWSLDHFYGFA